MSAPHKFQEVVGSRVKDKMGITRRLECTVCDSMVEYDVRVTTAEVNRRTSNEKFPCIPMPKADENVTPSGIILPSKSKN